jgi:hypothetical protein
MASPEEVQVLKQARLFRELLSHEGWKAYAQVLEAQIAAREEVVHCPIHALPPHFVNPSTDLASKAAAIESAKGAIIGLKIALNTPAATIESASEMARKSKESA